MVKNCEFLDVSTIGIVFSFPWLLKNIFVELSKNLFGESATQAPTDGQTKTRVHGLSRNIA